MTPRRAAAARVLALFLVAQLASFAVVQRGCSEYSRTELWTYGVAGPLTGVKAIRTFQYHPFPANAGFVLFTLLLLVAPAVHVLWPRRATLPLSALAMVLWILFGMGMSIDHM